MIRDAYLSRFRYSDRIERNGLAMTFESEHRPLQDYVGWLADAGFLVERLREPKMPDAAIELEPSRRWQRLPL
ncbi:MAG TPA: hypothetical protein VLN26_01705, partial [Gaiellaceae bacterium]|nr:hypothetical protein [Gaiellaceae bacterium]